MNIPEKLKHAKEAARKSGEIQMQHFGGTHKLDYKSEKDFATEIDYACEKEIKARIEKAFPDDGFLGEEDGITEGKSEHIWIVDPLDGTVNYAHGFPYFCTVIGLWNLEAKQVDMGVLYDPVNDKMYHAVRGEGAFLNDEAISVSNRSKLKDSFMTVGTYDVDVKNNRAEFDRYNAINKNIDKFLRTRVTGSAGIDLGLIAEGVTEIHVVHGTHPWDHLGPSLIISEAGGKSVDRNLNELQLESRGVIATNGHVFDELISLIS